MTMALAALMEECLLLTSEAAAIKVADLKTEPDGTGRLSLCRSKGAFFVSATTMRQIASWLKVGYVEDGPLFREIGNDGAVLTTAVSRATARSVMLARPARQEHGPAQP